MVINQKTYNDCIEIEPATPAKRSIICLHGLGAHGSDLVPIVPELGLSKNLAVRFIFPHAPVIPVTINNGAEMRAWYDIVSLSLDEHTDQDSITRSIAIVEAFIEKEKQRGVSTRNIVLAGFSQGAVMALMTSLFYPEKLGGTIALSGYLPLTEKEMETTSDINKNLPIFLAHGTQDPVVPYFLGQNTYQLLKQFDYTVDWHEYAVGHTIAVDEIKDLSRWIKKLWPDHLIERI